MYHRVGDARGDEADYAVDPAAFDAQVAWLAAGGRVVPAAALAAAGRAPGTVVLTFDDGCDSDLSVVLPRLRALGLPASFFVSPARLGAPGFLSWEALEELARSPGVEIGAHGLDHALFADLSDAALDHQLREARARLEARLGRPVEALSLPGGSGGDRAWRAARAAGYRMVFDSRPGLVSGPAPDAPLPRFAVRRSLGARAFRRLADQAWAPRAGLALRYAVVRRARALLGTGAYGRLRRRLRGAGA
jgi:peptidoglycan/xylan/chitin deacetylase (PgdA/CDA1 family)